MTTEKEAAEKAAAVKDLAEAGRALAAHLDKMEAAGRMTRDAMSNLEGMLDEIESLSVDAYDTDSEFAVQNVQTHVDQWTDVTDDPEGYDREEFMDQRRSDWDSAIHEGRRHLVEPIAEATR